MKRKTHPLTATFCLLLLNGPLLAQSPKPPTRPAGKASATKAETAPVKKAEKPSELHLRFLKAIERKDLTQVRALLAAGVDVRQRYENDLAPLDYAANAGSIAICEALLEKGAELNPPAPTYPPLYYAIGARQLATTKLLLERGASLKWELPLDQTPVGSAVLANSPEILDLLLDRGEALDPAVLLSAVSPDAAAVADRLLARKGADPNVRNEEGQTALMQAANEGKLALMEVLLKRGADVNLKDEIGKTALMYANGPTRAKVVARLKQAGAREFEPTLIEAVRQGDTRTVRAMLAKGVDANERDNHGRTPLFYAFSVIEDSLLKLLLEKGANPNARDKAGRSVVDAAKEYGSREAINALIEAGAEAPDIAVIDAILTQNVEQFKSAFTQAVDPNTTNEDGKPLLILAIEVVGGAPLTEAVDALLARGANINVRDRRNGYTALTAAAAGGYLELVRKLLAKGADPNLADDSNHTALMAVGGEERDAIARLLIEKGADVRAKMSSGYTVLMSIAGDHSPELLKLVYERGASADLRAADQYGTTALHSAAHSGNAANVKLLLEWGADARAASKDSKTTPLALALGGNNKSGDYPGTVRLLLKAGADPNARDDLGRTMLELAKAWGNPEIIALLKAAGARPTLPPTPRELLSKAVLRDEYFTVLQLLKKRVNPNITEVDSYTPLMNACLRGNVGMVNLLLAHGADPNLSGTWQGELGGKTPSPLHLAAEKGETEIVQLLLKKGAKPDVRWIGTTPLIEAAKSGHFETCRALIAAGAQVNVQIGQAYTPLLCAAMHRDTRLLKLLLQKGALVDTASAGTTPLMVAAEFGNTAGARILLQAGANAKVKSESGDTTLMAAASTGNVELIQLLLAKGVDVNARNDSNDTALSKAEDAGHTQAAELLKRAGAKP